ncbi:MAG: protein kinase [Proteobacteria bacterium]|nr:protein kinase [Pseudomonadota bacterium]
MLYNASMFHPPVTLGPFEVHRLLGEGGMATVYEATHRQSGLELVLKFLRHSQGRPEQLLRDEIHTVSALNHPSILRVFDQGIVDEDAASQSKGVLKSGSLYYAMELADLGSLRDHTGTVDWPFLRRVLVAILDALAHAHARGVIHCDIKPENVLLASHHSGIPRVLLADFGIALVRARLDERGGPEVLMGSPRYMAPEQFEGWWRDFCPATDLYALGCLAYELASNTTPYRHSHYQALAFAHVMETPKPPKPSFTVPRGFVDWVMRLLVKSPKGRFALAADARYALTQLEDPQLEDRQLDDSAHLTLDSVESATIERGTAAWNQPNWSDHHRAKKPPLPVIVPRISADWNREERPMAQVEMGIGLVGFRDIAMVDRDEERNALWQALGAVHQQHRPRLVLLKGPAGSGKSRLARWLLENSLETGAALGWRAVHSSTSSRADGLGPMLSRQLGCFGLAGTELLQRLEDMSERRCLAGVEPMALAAIIEGKEATQLFSAPRQRYEPILRYMSREAEQRPLVIWLDDVQWGEDALRFAAAAIEADTPALMVLTSQNEAMAERTLEPELLADLLDCPRCTQIEVGPLDEAAQRILLGNLLRLQGDLAARVSSRTNGNPLFAIELVRHWAEHEVLHQVEGGFILDQQADQALPGDLHTIWSSRIERLLHTMGQHHRLALERAAALGQRIIDEEWKAVCRPLLSMEQLQKLRNALRSAQLIVPMPGGWAFVHAMLPESIARTSRADGRWVGHHGAIANLLQQQYGDDPSVGDRLGRHLWEAGEMNEAVDALLVAADRRREVGQIGGSFEHLDLAKKALQSLDPGETDRRWGLLWLTLTANREHQGRFDEAEELAKRAMARAGQHRWVGIEGQAAASLGSIAMHHGDLDLAAKRIALGRAYAKAEGDLQVEVRSILSLARVEHAAGRLDAADRLLDEAEAYGLDDLEIRTSIHWSRGTLAWFKNDLKTAIEHFNEGLRLSSDNGMLLRKGLFLSLHGELARSRGDLSSALDWYQQSAQVLDGLGTSEAVVSHVNCALVHLAREDYAQVQQTLHQWLPIMEARGVKAHLVVVRAALMECAAAAEQWSSFDEHCRAFGELLNALSQIDADGRNAATRAAELAKVCGETARAEELLALL